MCWRGGFEQPGQKITLPPTATATAVVHKQPVAAKPSAAPSAKPAAAAAAAAVPAPAVKAVKVVPFVQLDLNPDLGDELGEFVSGSESASDNDESD